MQPPRHVAGIPLGERPDNVGATTERTGLASLPGEPGRARGRQSAAFPAWNESTARTHTTLSSRFVLPGVFSIAGSGDTTYYFTNTPTGSFSDPTTFATGTVIATSSGRYGDVNTVFAPGMGAISGSGQVTQNTASPVTIGGSPFTLGGAGTLLRVTYSGLATRTDPAANTSFTYFAGRAITIR